MRIPLSEVYKELDAVTDRLSTQVRTVALGVLAMSWLFLSGDKGAPTLSVAGHSAQLIWIASLCVLTLLADLLQYQFGYWSARATMIQAEAAKENETSYDSKAFSYRARLVLFWAKQVTAVAAALWLLLLLLASI